MTTATAAAAAAALPLGYLSWERYVEQGKHLPQWPPELRDKAGRRIRVPQAWYRLYAERHPRPVPPVSLAHVPSRLKGPGVYVAEGSLNDLFQHAHELGWVAAIPYYWTDDQISRFHEIQAANGGLPELALWFSWWGWRGWDSPGEDANGQWQKSVRDQLARFGSRVYIGEVEFGSDPDPTRNGFWQRAQTETLALYAPLKAAGVEPWIISDHLEVVAQRAGGRIPDGWNLQSECYADWVEYVTPGDGVYFRAPAQLALAERIATGVAWLPVEGYFAPEQQRDEASTWYVDDRRAIKPLAWGGWRGDGSMTPANYANVTRGTA